MMSVFTRATSSRRCPVCAGDHSCSWTHDDLHLCRRRHHGESVPGWRYLGESRDGVWGLWRRAGDDRSTPRDRARDRSSRAAASAPPRPRSPAPPTPWQRGGGWPGLVERLADQPHGAQVARLAAQLGVTPASLHALGTLYCPEAPAYTRRDGTTVYDPECWLSPERDGAGNVISAATRDADGGKRQVGGGRRGLAYPLDWRDRADAALTPEGEPGPIYLVEGPSDTAALLTLGLCAVGRPSNSGGTDHLAVLLRDVPPSQEITLVGERDRHQTDRGEWVWPGLDGALLVARRLAVALGRPVRVALTPGSMDDVRRWRAGERGPMEDIGDKDVRAWLNRMTRDRRIDLTHEVRLRALGHEFEAWLELVEVVLPTARAPAGGSGDTATRSAAPTPPPDDAGTPGQATWTSEEEEILGRAAEAARLADEVWPLAEAVHAAVRPPRPKVIDLADLDDDDLASPLLAGMVIRPGRRAKGCGDVQRFRHRAMTWRQILMSIKCGRWACGECVKHLKREWTDHLTELIVTCPTVYVWYGPAVAWESIGKSIRDAGRASPDGAAGYARYTQHGDNLFVLADVPFTVPLKHGGQVIELDGAKGAALTAEIIAGIPQTARRPISTSRKWQLTADKSSPEWERVGYFGLNYTAMKYKEILSRFGIASEIWDWQDQPWRVNWVLEIDGNALAALSRSQRIALYGDIRPAHVPERETG
jgi:hypothetical protein